MKLPAWFIALLVIAAMSGCGTAILLAPQIIQHFNPPYDGWRPVKSYSTPLPAHNL